MGIDRWLMIVRLVAYVILVPSLCAIAIDAYNDQRPRRAGLWALIALYYGIALGSVVSQTLGLDWSAWFRAMLTPVLILQAGLAVWVWRRPRKGGK